MIKRFINKISKNVCSKATTAIDALAVTSVFGILLYRIDALRKICRDICFYVTSWFIHINLETIQTIYLKFEIIFRIIIVVFVTIRFISWILKLGWEYWLKRQKGDNRFEESIFRYLQDSSIPRCFLVTGAWGSGKTYEAEQFLDKYYRWARTKVYRISCFGLDTRKELIKEISNTIEQQDKSFYSLTIKALEFLPVIGGAVEKFLKKSYGYDSVKQGSIFIFDDFERVTSRAIVRNNSSHLYNTSSFLLSKVTQGRSALSEFKEIKKEFESIEKSFRNIENFITQNLERSDIDKYNIIIGLINDIIEIYGMKVIIICNSEILGEKFIHDILRSKLNCVEYKKIISSKAKISIIDNCIETKIFEDTDKELQIKEYLNYIKANINDIIWNPEFNNLRMFGGLLEAFIITADLFEAKDLTMKFMNSLFNSVMLVHIAFYHNEFSYLDTFITGANIEFLLRLFRRGSHLQMIRLKQKEEDIKWVDVRVSGYWILSLSCPNNVSSTIGEWNTYKFYKDEKQLCDNKENFLEMKECNLLHLFYYQRNIDDRKKKWEEYRQYVDTALKQYNVDDIEVIRSIVDAMEEIFQGRIYEDLFSYLFDKLSKGHENQQINGNGYIHEMYNTYREKKSLH